MVYLEPTKSRVVVRPIKADTETPGGIILPDRAQKQQTNIGTIVSIPGSDEAHDDHRMGLGAVVVFADYAGVAVEFENEALMILDVKDILAVVLQEGD